MSRWRKEARGADFSKVRHLMIVYESLLYTVSHWLVALNADHSNY